MSNSEIEQSGTVKGHLPNEASLSGRISNGLSLSGHISIGSGAGDFIIKMTIEVNGDNYTVTSCDKTMEQIDAAVASGQNIKAIAFDKYVMPMTQMEYSESYTFGAFLGSFLIAANVAKNHESGTDDWQFYLSPITADIVEYSNAAIPRISTVSEALDEIVPNSHTHSNKLVLDKFAETDGKPTYNGDALGGGAGDFIIKMTVETEDGDNYTVTSCDKTMEQIDAAVSAEKRVVLIATDTTSGVFWELPIIQAVRGQLYDFGTFLGGQVISSIVYEIENESKWHFSFTSIEAGSVSYSNAMMPSISTVEDAIDKLVLKSYTKIQGSNMFLDDNTEYRLADVTTLKLKYPTGDFECWMRLTFAASGDITVTFPTGTKYIGTTPNFKNGETWEMSIKDGVVIAQKVGDGT